LKGQEVARGDVKNEHWAELTVSVEHIAHAILFISYPAQGHMLRGANKTYSLHPFAWADMREDFSAVREISAMFIRIDWVDDVLSTFATVKTFE